MLFQTNNQQLLNSFISKLEKFPKSKVFGFKIEAINDFQMKPGGKVTDGWKVTIDCERSTTFEIARI